MPYKVIHPTTGILVLCDTPQQVSELLKEFSKPIPTRTIGTVPAPGVAPWSAYSAMRSMEGYEGTSLPLRGPSTPELGSGTIFSISRATTGTSSHLQGNARKVADALIARAGSNISSEELKTILGSSSVEGIGPSLRWQKPHFAAVGVDLGQILQKTPGQAATWTIIPSDHLHKLKEVTALSEGSS